MSKTTLLQSFDSQILLLPSFKYVELNRLFASCKTLIAILFDTDSCKYVGASQLKQIEVPIKFDFRVKLDWKIVCEFDPHNFKGMVSFNINQPPHKQLNLSQIPWNLSVQLLAELI